MDDPEDADTDENGSGTTAEGGDGTDDGTNVTVTDAGETEPAPPKWEKPDVEDIPEFETGGQPATGGKSATGGHTDGPTEEPADPTAGKPNEARSPGASRLDEHSTEAYVAAIELCARLPEDLRLPAEAADLVPVAFEAELEQNIQSFAATEFDNQTPHVEALEFVEAEGDVWLKLRLGVPDEVFGDLKHQTDALREYALEELDQLF
ncbi:MAG: hypothetical protein ACI8XM_002064 [Haloarculaceae archaeon]|jgi:hypothetical protein